MNGKGMVAILVTVGLFGLSCSGAPEQPTADGAAPTQTADAGGGDLPEGHPAVGDPQARMTITPPPTGSGTGAAGLTWDLPAGWEEVTPSSRMRKAQYRVPGADGDGEVAVFYFGPGQGGDAMSNALRWARQFQQPDGRPSTEVMKTEELDVNGISVLLVEVTGTYTSGGPMMGGAGEPKPDHMLLGAIATGPDSNWFFKFTGPEQTVREQRGAFTGMLRSLQTGA